MTYCARKTADKVLPLPAADASHSGGTAGFFSLNAWSPASATDFAALAS